MAERPEPTIDDQGREVLAYPSGVVIDAKTGRLLRGPTNPDLNPVLKDPAGMGRRHAELARQAARDAIDAAVAETNGLDLSKQQPGYGWFAIVKHTAKEYLASQNIRGMGEVLTKLGMAAGYLGRDGEPEQPVKAPNGITAPPEQILELIREMEREINARVDKAQAKDAE